MCFTMYLISFTYHRCSCILAWAYFYSGSTIVGSWTLITRIRVPYINSGSSVIIAASNKTGILYEGVIGSLQGAYAFVAFQQGTWNYLHTGFLCPNFCTSVVTVQCSNNMAFIPGTAVCNSPYSGAMIQGLRRADAVLTSNANFFRVSDYTVVQYH